MKIKTPVMYDTSRYEIIPDFAKVNPKPFLVSTKATEGSTWIDPTFAQYWQDLKQDGIYRSAFHFFKKAIPSAPQAQNFLDTLSKNEVDPKDIFVLDVEEVPTSATQIIAWLDIVEAKYYNLIMIYSRANILNGITMTATQMARLRTYPIWTAGYPTNPDLFDSPPQIYIPDQSKWGKPWAWQYSESGIVSGIEGEVDLNWMSPELIRYLGGTNMTYYGTVTTTAVLNIRSGPGTSYVDIGDLRKDDKVEASEIVGGWWHLSKINNAVVTQTSWASGAYITETTPPVTPPPATDLSEIKAQLAQIAGAHVTELETLQAMQTDLVTIATDVKTILAKLNSDTTPNPTPSSDGYMGKHLGFFKITAIAGGFPRYQPLNGDGGFTTPMQDRTVDWMAANCPGWDDFVHPAGNVEPPITFDGNLWHIQSRVLLGQVVRVAEIVSKRARIVGMDADGDPFFAAVNLDACSPTATPWYFHKVTGVPRYYPQIQPRGKDAGGFPQCWWIDTNQVTLEKVG